VVSWSALTIGKSVEPALAVQAGDDLTYTLTITNPADAIAIADGTLVVDLLPAHVTFVDCSPACLRAGQDISWNLGSLWPAESRELTLRARAHSPLVSGTLLHNQASVSATNALASAQAQADVRVLARPSFQVSKQVYPADVTAGTTLTYTVLVTNTGNETAWDVLVEDLLPEPFSFGGMVSGDSPAVVGRRLLWSGQVVTGTVWPAGWLAPAGPLTLVFTATAGGVNGTTYYNSVTVTHAIAQETSGPAAPVTVDVPDLRIHKTASADWGMPGRPLTYTIVYSNASAVPATGVVLADTLPEYIAGGYANPAPDAGTFAAGETVTWDVGALAGRSGDRTASVVVTLTLPLTDGLELVNRASIACEQGVSAATEPVTTRVTSAPDMILRKTVFPSPPGTASPNDTVTYTLAVENVGSAAVASTITDVLPPGLADVISTTSPNVTFAMGEHPAYTWTVQPLPPGEPALITITARIATDLPWGQRTIVTNTAGVENPDDPVGDNNGDAAALIVVPGAAAVVTMTADPPATTVDCQSVVTAEVRDAWGNAVEDGTPVGLTTSMDTSRASPSLATTSGGYATATLTATRPGTVVVTATVAGLASEQAAVDFGVGVPKTFVFDPVVDPQTAGAPFTISFTAFDQFGNPADTYTGVAELSDGTGSLTPPTSHAAASGRLSQTVSITRATPADVITATARVTTACGASWTAVGQSNPFAVRHGAAAGLGVAPLNATVGAGQALAYSALASDAYGNVWISTADTAFATSGGNAFLGAAPGNAIFSATVAGVGFPITATIPGVAGVVSATTSVTVTRGLPTRLTIAPRDVHVVAGAAISYTAIATDAFGNDWDATASVVWSAGGGNVFQNNVLSATVAGVWPVSAALAAPGISDQTQVTIAHAAVSALDIGSVASPQTAGTPFGLTITAYDAFGNVADTFVGTLLLTDETGTLTPATFGVWSNGVAAPLATITRAWLADRITATVAAAPSIFAVSQAFDVVAGPPDTVVYTVPSSLAVCEAHLVTATVQDHWSNPVEPGTVVTVEADSARLWFRESGTFVHYAPTGPGGTVTATLVAGTLAGPQPGWTRADAATASSGLLWVAITSPGLPAQIQLVAQPQVIPVGGHTGVLTATVRDCAGHAVEDGTSVSFGILPPLAALGPAPVPTVGGVATAAFTSGAVAGTAVASSWSLEAVATTTLVFEPGPAFTLTLTAQPASLTANGTDTATLRATVTDQHNNPVPDGTLVHFALAPTLGALTPNPAPTVSGEASAIFTAGTLTGTTIITASASGLSSVVEISLRPAPSHFAHLPLVALSYSAHQLVVESISFAPSHPTVETPVVVSVTIRNLGGATVDEPFWVDLYLDPTAAPRAGDLWNELCLHGKAWYVRDPIPASGALVLHTDMPDDPANPDNRYSSWPAGALGLGAHALWAQVDTYLAPPGMVHEGDETDNILGPLALVVTAPLPIWEAMATHLDHSPVTPALVEARSGGTR
jgi:uncharacterized repeat protein (TIGR01451 family)